MAKSYVICKYCNERFDRNSEPFVAVGARRYAHKSCAEKYEASIPQEEKDYYDLEEYIKKLFNIDTIGIRIKKQIKEFREEYKYTYSGIKKTLHWWYKIKQHNIDESNGALGIVPYVYKDALNYYYSIYMAQLINEDKTTYVNQIEEIEIAPPIPQPNSKKMFKLSEEEENE